VKANDKSLIPNELYLLLWIWRIAISYPAPSASVSVIQAAFVAGLAPESGMT